MRTFAITMSTTAALLPTSCACNSANGRRDRRTRGSGRPRRRPGGPQLGREVPGDRDPHRPGRREGHRSLDAPARNPDAPRRSGSGLSLGPWRLRAGPDWRVGARHRPVPGRDAADLASAGRAGRAGRPQDRPDHRRLLRRPGQRRPDGRGLSRATPHAPAHRGPSGGACLGESGLGVDLHPGTGRRAPGPERSAGRPRARPDRPVRHRSPPAPAAVPRSGDAGAGHRRTSGRRPAAVPGRPVPTPGDPRRPAPDRRSPPRPRGRSRGRGTRPPPGRAAGR